MTESTRSPLVQPWDIIEIGASDYLNGDGPLRLRVIHVRADAAHPNIEWIHLLGTRLHGSRDGQMMMVMVRAAALHRPGAVIRPGPAPGTKVPFHDLMPQVHRDAPPASSSTGTSGPHE
ncbi:hypothetical protein [Solwaraspora sp. WMMD792]|uniref:hypothetical protein n=1 Tax=Solwaraspora sp. WMMD792 TaxID=3016099 RepID=UPI002417ED6A|nr:hypothetical protein [Solwaraspora sp. WMMD792]MDG4769584.1 hypothetical protein [Solwaraspora sp. WMMD792]